MEIDETLLDSRFQLVNKKRNIPIHAKINKKEYMKIYMRPYRQEKKLVVR